MQATKKISSGVRNLVKIVKTSKKLPITLEQAQKLRNNGIDAASFQRTCRNHYNTKRIGNILYLHSTLINETTGELFRTCRLDFSEWHLTNRVIIKVPSELFDYNFICDGNRDLFIKLLRHKLI